METFEEQRISKSTIPNPLLLKEGTLKELWCISLDMDLHGNLCQA
jgi:hypothetical protein